jgi:uncharacterized protein YjcR
MKDHITIDLEGKSKEYARTAIESGTPYEKHYRGFRAGMRAVFNSFYNHKLFDENDIQRAYNAGKQNMLDVKDIGETAFIGSYSYLETIKSDN